MVRTVDVLSPLVRSNPYPLYKELRDTAPVSRIIPGGFWAISRYSDIQYVLRETALFSSGAGFRAVWQPVWLDYNPVVESMLLMDPPQHTDRRKLVSKAFTSRVLSHFEERVRAIAAERVAAIEPGTPIDVVPAFSATFPAMVIAELLGMVDVDPTKLGYWLTTLATVSPATPECERDGIRAVVKELEHCLAGLIETRRRSPNDNLITELCRAEVGGEHLSNREIIAFVALLLAAGIETSTHLISQALRFLASSPDMVELLHHDSSKLPLFIGEMLRYDGPIHGILRVTTSDVEIAGVTIPKDQFVLCLVGSANHDESQFSNPERFELTRDTQRLMTFGFGPHYCIGASFGRCEAEAAIGTLLNKFSGLSLAGDVAWNTSLITRGPSSLPLQFSL